LPKEFRGDLPSGVSRAVVFCAGCLVLQGESFAKESDQAQRLARDSAFAEWPIIILHDDASVASSPIDFLWSTWTRFEPAADIHAAKETVIRHHISYTSPIVIDARLKPGFPKELVVRQDVADLVDRRWREYFPSSL
jgi:hypothetical protein